MLSRFRGLAVAAAFVLAVSGPIPLVAQEEAPEPCAEAATADASPSASPAASPVADASPVASPESATAAAECTVDIVDLAFMPADIEVAVGTTVTWTNSDTVPHTATAADGTFDSGVFDPGDTFSFTLEEAGTFDYACLLHPEMLGSVVVR